MELESGSPSVARGVIERPAARERRRRRRRRPCGACASDVPLRGLDRRIDAHHSRDVGDHVDEDADLTSECGAHELSKPSVTVARWSAERIGPTIIAAPHRGHAHVARVSVAVVAAAVASVDVAAVDGVASRVRASATRATRQVFARNPDCRMRTKPRGRMCWTKRRRNSIAESVIVRRASPWA